MSGIELVIYDLNTSAQTTEPQIPVFLIYPVLDLSVYIQLGQLRSYNNSFSRFSDDSSLVSEYLYNMYGRTSSHDRSCDPQCVHETICTVSNIVLTERSKCIGSWLLMYISHRTQATPPGTAALLL